MASHAVESTARVLRAPGLSVDTLGEDLGAAPEDLGADAIAFLGFRRPPEKGEEDLPPEPRVFIARMDHWDSQVFDESVRPARDGFLRDAVRGFFANGGRLCIVMAVAEGADTTERVDSLLDLLRPEAYLAGLEEVAFVAVPDVMSTHLIPNERQCEVQTAVLQHCAQCGDRFAILDAPRPLQSEDPSKALATIVWPPRSEFGAMYFPWLLAARSSNAAVSGSELSAAAQWRSLQGAADHDGVRSGRWVPPSGHVAGLYSRLGAPSGGYCAPANESLCGVLDTSYPLSAPQRALLNQAQLNCIITRSGRGVQVMGERTLSGHPRLAFVSSVLVVIGLRRWIRRNMTDLVFEPLVPELWDRIRRRLTAHCLDLWRDGSLAGEDASEAFSVRCNAETNPPQTQEDSQVVAHIRLAPSVPAEFIDIKVVLDAGGITVRGP
jgi:hypothetical protein